jgi:hypothetical protein
MWQVVPSHSLTPLLSLSRSALIRQACFIKPLVAVAKYRFLCVEVAGMAGIEPTPSESELDWTPLSP